MIKRKVLFILIILLILAGPALLINSPISYVPLVFVFIFIGFSYLYIFAILKTFRISVASEGLKSYERLLGADYHIGIENKWILVMPRVSFSMLLENEDGYKVKSYEYDFILSPKEKKDLELNMHFPHIGKFRVKISKIKFYGFVDIFYIYKKSNWEEELLISPKIYKISDYKIDTTNPIFTVDYNVPYKIKGGEFNDVREYIPGDSMKNIHWKLSAHSNTLITRIVNTDALSGISIYMDFSRKEKFDYERHADIYDTIVESAYSCGIYSLNSSYGLNFIFSSLNKPSSYSPKLIEELNDLLNLLPKVSASEKYPLEILLSEYGSSPMSYDNIIILSPNADKKLAEVLSELKRKGKYPFLFYISDSINNVELDEDLKNILTKNGIKYTSIKTAKEFTGALRGVK